MDSRFKGSLTVIAGSMFAGKTEELIRRVRRMLYAGRRVQVFKHALDTRSDGTGIRSHSGALYEAGAVSTSGELLESVEPSTDLVAIEETQFFDVGIVDVCNALADRGCGVIASGLDMDFRGEPFGPIPRFWLRPTRSSNCGPSAPGAAGTPPALSGS